MKKLGIIVTALAFMVTLTQCKKEEQPITANESGVVAITLDIRHNGGTRMDVNTGTGEVTYENGDVIYVASGGKFIGTLTHNGTNFTGTIIDPTVGEPLHFYFLGNVTPAETLSAGTSTICSVVISDQTEHLPVIEYAPSNENYVSGTTTFTAMLLNKCALAKFNVTTSSEFATCLTGFNNKVTVGFSENNFTYSQENNGVITLSAGNGEKWAILLPQEAIEAGEEGSVYSVDGEYTGTFGAVPAITDNSLLATGIEVNVTTEAILVGAIRGKFTINENGDQVYFSKGNLQYNKTTAVWSFMQHQYDMVETDEQDVGMDYSNQNIVSLFSWGTSGYNHGANAYQPWKTHITDNDCCAYGNWQYNLYDQTGQADWGYNAISNGGNTENQWRTLTMDEWYYLFNSRGFYSQDFGWRFFWTWGTVNGVQGVILLPDDWWSTSSYDLYEPYWKYRAYHHNIITAADWTNVLEANGAVFLPASGYREGSRVEHAGSYFGYYWSSSYDSASGTGCLQFDGGYLDLSTGGNRSDGLSVRLVHNVE